MEGEKEKKHITDCTERWRRRRHFAPPQRENKFFFKCLSALDEVE